MTFIFWHTDLKKMFIDFTVSNKWIREKGQIFKRPCLLEAD